MDDAIVSLRQSDEHSHKPPGQAEGLHTSLDVRTTLPYDRITQDRHIRVLDLAPGSWEEPVNCFLRTVHLDDDELRYEAISYAWGDPSDRQTVVCNGNVVSTTRSLFEALQRFRYADTPRTLWADALCINQTDNDERTSQVRLMGFIYTKAVRVLVWLQHEDDQVVLDSLNAICRYILRSDGFARFPQILKHQKISQMLYKWLGMTVTSVGGDDPPDIDLAATHALRQICSPLWFSRGWVVQEVALGISTSVFWGHAEIGFEWLGVAASCGILSASHDFSFGMLHCYFLFELCPLFKTYGPLRKSCFALLRATMHVTFSDPKDRIYGLLGLSTLEYDPTDGRLLVDPDYSITTMECHRRVASKLLLEWHELRVLSWAGHRSEFAEDWPSWVPDWSRPRIVSFGPVSDLDWATFGEPGLTHISETVNIGNYCIDIPGFRVDTVDREVKEYLNLGDFEDIIYGPARLQAMLRSLAHVYDQRYLACTFGNRFRYRPLNSVRIANLLSEYHIFINNDSTQNMYRLVPAELYRDDHPSSFAPSADRFFDRCRRDRPGHTLFITSTGMLGLGSEALLTGDVVVVLHGTSIPFVLRPAADGLWRLVGECYLYNVNEGRVHREWEEKGSVSEKFCIY
ncbi:heterokaryon incompatibility protein-domain-containing protein [Alternaria rosae]|uniref:heterokaryon incompatibility protein-domain-containing protein n=1 Tax=Alternaria rosae TaxID=1187941 RepID=UPI001E8E8B9E|nr:heterokaryon incompatibility protein-domain-containing protein [Alternaria rosae]KAH6865970.1 heterokaryon incompatibility protein-domain-containing protein [Alternaria rosae]